jgi:hypothetical protein
LFVGMSAAGEQPSWHLLLPFAECADCLPISEALQQFIAAVAAGRQPEESWSVCSMHGPTLPPDRTHQRDPLLDRLRRWQTARTWARLIREAEALWHVDVRILHRLAAMELGQLLEEVPPRMRRRVNQWLERFHTATRLR